MDTLTSVAVHLCEGVPMILDDITPSRPQGSRRGMDVDGVKKLLESGEQAGGVDARFHDPVFCRYQCRLFTSNAQSPNEWHSAFPTGYPYTAEAIKVMSPDARALLRRAMFCVVSESLVGEAQKAKRRNSAEEESAKRMKALIQTGLHFSGSALASSSRQA